MNIGATSLRPARAGARRGTARTFATAVLVTAVCGAGQLVATTGPARAVTGTAEAGAATTPPTASAATTEAGGRDGSASVGSVMSPRALSAAAREAWAMASEVVSVVPLLAALNAAVAKPPIGTTGTAGRPAAGKPVNCRRVKCVALTFDDGPGEHTDALLRHLGDYGARATFFVVGRNVAAYPGVLRRTYAAGHEIGGHTWSHPNLTKLSAAGVRSQLARTDQAIKAVIGVRPKLVRPPYGAFNATVRRQTDRPMVMWSVDTLDWLHRDSAKVARKAVKKVRPGSVVLFHDIHPTTVRAMPKILKSLSKRGYRFVTVSQLYGGKPPRVVYGS